jgi:hypothetical protein
VADTLAQLAALIPAATAAAKPPPVDLHHTPTSGGPAGLPRLPEGAELPALHTLDQCCGSGSGIRCFFTPRIRDPDPEWSNGRIRIRDKLTKFVNRGRIRDPVLFTPRIWDPDPGWSNGRIRDPG